MSGGPQPGTGFAVAVATVMQMDSLRCAFLAGEPLNQAVLDDVAQWFDVEISATSTGVVAVLKFTERLHRLMAAAFAPEGDALGVQGAAGPESTMKLLGCDAEYLEKGIRWVRSHEVTLKQPLPGTQPSTTEVIAAVDRGAAWEVFDRMKKVWWTPVDISLRAALEIDPTVPVRVKESNAGGAS